MSYVYSLPILFLDIETVPCVPSYRDLPARLKPLWEKKASSLGAIMREDYEACFFDRAGIYAEFGKVVAIAVGVCKEKGGVTMLCVKGFADHDEAFLLQQLKDLLAKFPGHIRLCAHNGKEFDFPYLARRYTVHEIPLPAALDTAGKKPWEVQHIDTMELWKFGDRKTYTSLELLAVLFNIPSSKNLMDGGKVAHYYYAMDALEKIRTYCMEDVVVEAQLYRKLTYQPLFPISNIERE